MALLTIVSRQNSVYETPIVNVFDPEKVVYAYADPDGSGGTVILYQEKSDPRIVKYLVSESFATSITDFGGAVFPLNILGDSKRMLVANALNPHVYRGPAIIGFNLTRIQSVTAPGNGLPYNSFVYLNVPGYEEPELFATTQTPAQVQAAIDSGLPGSNMPVLIQHTIAPGEESLFILPELVGNTGTSTLIGNGSMADGVDYTTDPVSGEFIPATPLTIGDVLTITIFYN